MGRSDVDAVLGTACWLGLGRHSSERARDATGTVLQRATGDQQMSR